MKIQEDESALLVKNVNEDIDSEYINDSYGKIRFKSLLDFKKLVFIFLIGCLLGYIIEVVYCLVNKGYFESKQGMVYGPFSQIYGFGAVIMTLVLIPVSKNKKRRAFIAGMLVGGIYEFSCSFIQENIFGTKSWDFSKNLFNFNGRTSLLYMFFWGLLSMFFVFYIYPFLSKLIDYIPKRIGTISAWIILIFFVFNMLVSSVAVMRWTERRQGVEPKNSYYEYIDKKFPDERMEKIYPTMWVVDVEE